MSNQAIAYNRELRMCPVCFLIDWHDRLDMAHHPDQARILLGGGNVCPECEHADPDGFPLAGSEEAQAEVIGHLKFIIRGHGVTEMHRRQAATALEIIENSWRAKE